MTPEEMTQLARLAREKSGAVTASSVREVAVNEALASELLQEQATTLSRLGQRLDAAAAELRQVAEDLGAGRVDAASARERDRTARERFLRLRWEMTVVREAMGLRQVRREIDQGWPIPPRLPSP